MKKEILTWEEREALREKKKPGRPRIYKVSEIDIPNSKVFTPGSGLTPANEKTQEPKTPQKPVVFENETPEKKKPETPEKTQQEKDIEKYLKEVELDNTEDTVGITKEDLEQFEENNLKASDMIDTNGALRVFSEMLNLWKKSKEFTLSPEENKVLRNNINTLLDSKPNFLKGNLLIAVTIINVFLIYTDKFIKDAENKREIKHKDGNVLEHQKRKSIQENNIPAGEYAEYRKKIENAEQNNNDLGKQGDRENNENKKPNS